MGCRKFRSYMDRHYDGELSWKQKEDLSQHIRNCLSCREGFYQADKLRDLISNLDTFQPSLNFNTKLWRRIHKEKPQPAREMIFTLGQKVKWALATSLVTTVVLLVVVLTDPRLGLMERQQPRTAQEKIAPDTYQPLLGSNKINFVMDNFRPSGRVREADNPNQDKTYHYVLERKAYPQPSGEVDYVLPVISTQTLIEEESF